MDQVGMALEAILAEIQGLRSDISELGTLVTGPLGGNLSEVVEALGGNSSLWGLGDLHEELIGIRTDLAGVESAISARG